MVRRHWFWSLALSLVLVGLLALAPDLADARAGGGGSFGSRGMNTYSAPPATATAPRTAAPIERSMTPAPRPTSPAYNPALAASRPGGFFSGGGFMSGLFGGFIGAGIAGMLFGHGFFGGIGGFGSILGLIIQIGVIYLLVRLAIGFFRNRSSLQPAFGGPAPADQHYFRPPDEILPPQSAGFGGGATARSANIEIPPADFDAFEKLLTQVQAEWSKGDLAALRRHVTPEMLSYFSELLAANTSRGRENHVEQVKLLQGDLSEAWAEGDTEYATVAMRFGLVDWTVDVASGKTVEGDQSRPTEATELWTFMRARGGNWLLSAIQQVR
jgi:predicted lipid-binding transport protein (Tim44 family)